MVSGRRYIDILIKIYLLDVGALIDRDEIEEDAMSIFEEARKKQVCKLQKAKEKSNKEMEKVLTGLVEQASYLSIEVCNFVSHFLLGHFLQVRS